MNTAEYTILRAKIDNHEVERDRRFPRQSYPSDTVFDNPAPTNAERAAVQMFEFMRDKPARYGFYVQPYDEKAANLAVTWTGEKMGEVIRRGAIHRNNFGARWMQLTIRAINGVVYSGRWYFDRQQYVNVKAVRR